MTIQQKIALKVLAQRVSRGIWSESQAKIEFTKITGREPDEDPADDDQEGQELGKYMDALSASYPVPDPSQLEGPTIELDLDGAIQEFIKDAKPNQSRDKRIRKAKANQ